MTTVERQLLDLLRMVSNDRDFLIGVLTNVKTDEDRMEIIEYLKSTQEPDMDYIVLMSIYREKQRRGEMIEDENE